MVNSWCTVREILSYLIDNLCNFNIIEHQPQNSLLRLFWNFVGFKTEILRKIPPLESEIQPGDSLLCKLSVLNYCSNVTQYIRHVGNVCGTTDVDFQEDPCHGIRESEKKAHCCSSKVPIITDGSQQYLRCYRENVWSEKREFSEISLQQKPR